MGNNTGRALAALGAVVTVGCGVAAGIAIYKNREWLKSFKEELLSEMPPARPEPPQPEEEVNIVIDCSDDGEE